MADSAPSAIVTATSPAAAAPMAPGIDSVTFNKLVASVVITMPTLDVDGGALTDLKNIKVLFGLTGSDPSAWATPMEFPGTYPAGSQQMVAVTAPAYNTAYDFECEVSN